MQARSAALAAAEEEALTASDPIYARFRRSQERHQMGAESYEGCMHEETLECSQGHSVTVTRIHCVICGLLLKVGYSSTWESGDPPDEIYDATWHAHWQLSRRGANHHIVGGS